MKNIVFHRAINMPPKKSYFILCTLIFYISNDISDKRLPVASISTHLDGFEKNPGQYFPSKIPEHIMKYVQIMIRVCRPFLIPSSDLTNMG